jgi:CheY-like chemotaxis protein
MRGRRRPTPRVAVEIPATVPARRRVLVTDDDADSATSLAMMLEWMGNEVRTAHDGLAAVETAAIFRPDVILLDLGMPRLDGYEACRIREQPWARGVVMAALTGWSHPEHRTAARLAGFDHYLVKPVEPAAFEELLAKPAREAPRSSLAADGQRR